MMTWDESVGTLPLEPISIGLVLNWGRRSFNRLLVLLGYRPCATCGRMISSKQAFFDFDECRECGYVTKIHLDTAGHDWSDEDRRRARSLAMWVREFRDIRVA